MSAGQRYWPAGLLAMIEARGDGHLGDWQAQRVIPEGVMPFMCGGRDW